MFTRALLVALCCAFATCLTSLTGPGDDDCALYLTGPGRSSAYDYSLNLLKGNFGYDGQHTCITYEAINQAYLDARNRILVSQPKGDWKAEDFASVGELILDISISLARTYGLTYEEIEKGLPLIDTSRTLIREVCPPVFSHVECRAGKYRRLDGLCNNLRHPTWGATMAPFQRLIGPLFADGINAPRIAHTGRDLPLSRVVSRTMHPDDGFHDHAGTVMVIAWGQFMDHDYTLTGTPLDPINRNDPEECCKRPPHLKHPYCNEIRVPDDDYFYRLFGVKCIDFVRGFPSPRPGCRLGSRVPFNTLTGAIDGNTVYGVTEKFSRKLRTGYGGLLRMNPVFKEYGLKDLLPLKLDIPDEGCTRPNKNMYCFEAGEIRVNEQLVLTVMHTLMAREHNRVAEGLAAVNPHWDDETLFQEARRINIAEIQHITYNEFLPILLGKDVMEKFGLVLDKEGHWDGYDPEVNPDVIDSFAAAAYRFGHSLLPTAVERWSKAHKFIASKRLSDLIRRPYDLYRAGVLDEYVMGLMNQVAQAMDDSITQEVTNHLFKKVGARFGMDLVSFNMQRGREFGLPGYMEFRKFCGLSGADSFQDLFGSMANETIRKYETIFEHPIDVDLWSGGVSERPLPGSMLGPTFACVIATQFSYSRRGDRFWFELPNQPSSFTPEQLVEIRKSRLARVICDNTDIIDTVQLYPMVLPDHELNPRVPCRSGIIPSMDFSKWAEPVPFAGAKQYMTGAFVSNQTGKQTNHTDKKCVGNNITTLNESLSSQNTSNLTNSINNFTHSDNTLPNENLVLKEKEIANKTNGGDTVLKYVYKAGENIKNNEKSKGYNKNSLKRRKRSERVDINAKIGSDLHINHNNRDKAQLILPKLTPNGIISSAHLADFNIETLHDMVPLPEHVLLKNTKNLENVPYSSILSNDNIEDKSLIENNNENRSYENEDSDESLNKNAHIKHASIESDEIQKNDEFNNHLKQANYNNIQNNNDDVSKKIFLKEAFDKDRSSDEQSDENSKEDIIRHNDSTSKIEATPEKSKVQLDIDLENINFERIENSQENLSGSHEESNEKLENNFPKISSFKQKPVSDENNEEERRSSTEFESDILENNNFNDDKRQINFNGGEIKPLIELNIDNDDVSKEIVSKEIFDKDRSSEEQSDENSKEEIIRRNDSASKIKETPEKSKVLLDIDLKNINFERIENSQENLSGSPEESNEKLENNSPKTSSFKQTPVSEENNEEERRSSTEIESDTLENNDKRQINFNDDEVKPVIELNNEENSEESEELSKENLNENLKRGHNRNLKEHDTGKLRDTNSKTADEKVDVKQQYERIPLDYNHSNMKKEVNDTSVEENEDNNEGTIDALSPNENSYDDKLNIKFGDVTVKLPEIKLPEDILEYTYEPYKSHKVKHNYFDFDDEKKEYPDKSRNRDQSVENNDNYSPYKRISKKKNNANKNENYKDYNEHDEKDEGDEDLYEKFVRERFGKSGSFKKRTEKLRQIPISDENLSQTLQNILKKTDVIQKEAEKSGDPKAGFLWTLEYGQRL